jgi:uncharacterized membrane protein YgdD (TMEM256/DUF423 family)
VEHSDRAVTPRSLAVTAALLGATGVALGAFGAHALADVLRPERLVTFETAVRYQLLHAVALLALATLAERRPRVARAGALMAAGTVVFSGSLYALVASDLGLFGMVAPVGGTLLVLGWLAAGLGAWRG